MIVTVQNRRGTYIPKEDVVPGVKVGRLTVRDVYRLDGTGPLTASCRCSCGVRVLIPAEDVYQNGKCSMYCAEEILQQHAVYEAEAARNRERRRRVREEREEIRAAKLAGQRKRRQS